jgi:hypothetical protein
MFFIGVDLHKRTLSVCVMVQNGALRNGDVIHAPCRVVKWPLTIGRSKGSALVSSVQPERICNRREYSTDCLIPVPSSATVASNWTGSTRELRAAMRFNRLAHR